MATVVNVFVSDMHAGSTVAVCPPEIRLDDGGHYGASRAQLWLWERWGWFWKRVTEVCDQHQADETRHIYNGDIVDGDHHQTPQILSRHPGAQSAVTEALLAIPMALNPDFLFFVRGTEVHVGTGASTEEATAKAWKERGQNVQPDIDSGAASWWHLRMETQGKLYDVTHHGRTGFREHTRGSAASLYAADIFLSHVRRGERHPDFAIRGHFHRWNDSYDAQPTRFIQLPAWQLKTGYTHKKHADSVSDVGGLIHVLRDGTLIHDEKVNYPPARGSIWRSA